VQRQEQPYYTPEEVQQMFNRTPADAKNAHNTTQNHTDSSDKDSTKYSASTVTIVNTPHMDQAPGELPMNGTAPFKTTTQDTPGSGNPNTGSGRHLLEKPVNDQEAKVTS
jgi:uncharacterized protein involved in copper resistance